MRRRSERGLFVATWKLGLLRRRAERSKFSNGGLAELSGFWVAGLAGLLGPVPIGCKVRPLKNRIASESTFTMNVGRRRAVAQLLAMENSNFYSEWELW